MELSVEQLAVRAAELRAEGLTPEQLERRMEVDRRSRALQSGPIVRGPNAPRDGAFGGVEKVKP